MKQNTITEDEVLALSKDVNADMSNRFWVIVLSVIAVCVGWFIAGATGSDIFDWVAVVTSLVLLAFVIFIGVICNQVRQMLLRSCSEWCIGGRRVTGHVRACSGEVEASVCQQGVGFASRIL